MSEKRSPEQPPTPTEIRDSLSVGSIHDEFKSFKKVGSDEAVGFHQSGAKYSIKVKEIKDT